MMTFINRVNNGKATFKGLNFTYNNNDLSWIKHKGIYWGNKLLLKLKKNARKLIDLSKFEQFTWVQRIKISFVRMKILLK